MFAVWPEVSLLLKYRTPQILLYCTYTGVDQVADLDSALQLARRVKYKKIYFFGDTVLNVCAYSMLYIIIIYNYNYAGQGTEGFVETES